VVVSAAFREVGLGDVVVLVVVGVEVFHDFLGNAGGAGEFF
jgi:hypothetical protein